MTLYSELLNSWYKWLLDSRHSIFFLSMLKQLLNSILTFLTSLSRLFFSFIIYFYYQVTDCYHGKIHRKHFDFVFFLVALSSWARAITCGLFLVYGLLGLSNWTSNRRPQANSMVLILGKDLTATEKRENSLRLSLTLPTIF